MGIAIVYADRRRLLERSAVTTIIHGTADPAYDTDALLPDDWWRALPQDVASEVRPDPHAAASSLVEFVAVPDAPPVDAVHRFEPFGEWHSARFLGYTECPANQRTTTTDSRTGRRLGIHLDNFDRMPLERRHESRRRIGVNLGPGARYILLATQDVTRLAHLSPLIERNPHTDQVRRYVASGGQLACIRLRLEPGEGYIAPTELIPHDGSTWGVDEPSTVAFWLGEWPRGALPSVV